MPAARLPILRTLAPYILDSPHPLPSLFFPPARKSEGHLPLSQSLAHSLQKHPRCHQQRFLEPFHLELLNLLPATLLESTLVDVLRVLPCFDRSCPLASLLESALTRSAPVTTFRINTYKNTGGGPISPSTATQVLVDRGDRLNMMRMRGPVQSGIGGWPG